MITLAIYSLKSFENALYREGFKPEEIKPLSKEIEERRIRLPSKLKMMLANLSVPAILTTAEHAAHSLGVDVGSVPWQYVVASLGMSLTYLITRKYVPRRTAPLHATAHLTLNSSLFDKTSYGVFGLRGKKLDRPCEWVKNTFQSPVTDFLASDVHEFLPIPWFYLLSGVAYGGYIGLQTLEKKFKVVKKIKHTFLNVYNKVYDSYQESRLNKYLMRFGTSVTFAAASGAPLMAAAPLTAWAIADGIEMIKRKFPFYGLRDYR